VPKYLVRIGRERPEAFVRLLQAVIPAEVRATVLHGTVPLLVLRNFAGVPPERLEAERVPALPDEALPDEVVGRTAIEGPAPAREPDEVMPPSRTLLEA
jgi:hypothetical protein